MHRRTSRTRPTAPVWRGLAWVIGAVASLAAAGIAAVIAVVFAATMMVIAFMASILLALTAAAVRARRGVAAGPEDTDVIEARHVGGHSWVAYGWDRRE
jgi:cytochrome c oxidase assembly factor CtaG